MVPLWCLYGFLGCGLSPESLRAPASAGAEAERTSEDLKSFLLALGTAGIRTVHLMTHSMGGRVLTAAIPKLEVHSPGFCCCYSYCCSPPGTWEPGREKGKRRGYRRCNQSCLSGGGLNSKAET